MATETDDWLPTRRSLLTRLRDADDHAGWQQFFDTYWRLLYGVARKIGLTDAEAQDAVQDCFITVSRQMPNFRYQPDKCSFKGWLLMILRQRVSRQLKKRVQPVVDRSAPSAQIVTWDEATETNSVARVPDASGSQLDSIWAAEWQQHLLALAAERLKRQVSDAQFQIFDLHVLRGWPAGDVAQTLGISSAKVYLAKLRVGRRFRREIEAVKASAERGEP